MLVPYSKYQLVARPFGFTVPFRVAEVGATLLAALVVTVGGELVVKVWSEPLLVPASLVATSR